MLVENSTGVHCASPVSLDTQLSTARRKFRVLSSENQRFDASKHFSSHYLRCLASVLPLEEITAILSAEQHREQGLALSRGGDNEAASRFLLEARKTCELANLSHHAYLAATSFQLAAEAYVKHRRRDYHGAIRDLKDAIAAAVLLEDRYGHDMEFRRIHLARNILRVRASILLDEDVVADIVGLLRYIGGDSQCWPVSLGSGSGDPAAMIEAQKIWAIDELLLNLALPQVDVAKHRRWLPTQEECVRFHPEIQAAFSWCHAMACWSLDDDGDSFKINALAFFEISEGRLVNSGRHIDSLLELHGS